MASTPTASALDERPFRAVAMSVFASGAIPPREAIEWVCGLPNLESIVFGASSRSEHRTHQPARRAILGAAKPHSGAPARDGRDQAMTDVLTVGALGNVLLTRWKMLVAFVVLGVLAGIAYGMASPSTYTSKAVLFVIATPADKDGYYQAAQFAEKRAATYPALLTAPEVLDRTRSSLGLDMPASALIPMLTATNPTDSSLVEVAATAGTPELAAQLAGTVAQNLADYAIDLEDSGNNRGAVTIKLAVPAREPQYPSSPSPLMLGALGGLAGGALGIIAALTTNALRRRPRSAGGEAAVPADHSASRRETAPSASARPHPWRRAAEPTGRTHPAPTTRRMPATRALPRRRSSAPSPPPLIDAARAPTTTPSSPPADARPSRAAPTARPRRPR